jgi:hypothetical protein
MGDDANDWMLFVREDIIAFGKLFWANCDYWCKNIKRANFRGTLIKRQNKVYIFDKFNFRPQLYICDYFRLPNFIKLRF